MMYSEVLEVPEFDREYRIDELLAPVDSSLLDKHLDFMLGAYEVCDLNGNRCLGRSCPEDSSRHDIVLDFEPLALLTTACRDPLKIDMALSLIRMQLLSAQKYLMASALHIEAIQADYESLCQEHEALLASEARYRDLCEHLDEKVKAQVNTIETAQRKLFESERLASVGQLAAGVAHEINNPIGFMNSNLNTAAGYVNKLQQLVQGIRNGDELSQIRHRLEVEDLAFIVEDFQELLGETIDGGRRVADIVRDLRAFSNVDAEDELVIDLNQQIKVTINVGGANMDPRIHVNFQPGSIPKIRCKPGYIGQVVLALLMNAAEALKSTPAPTITISTRMQDEKVVVDVIDNGPGIPEHVLQRVFDPFFTTKDVGEGKGLGLTMCRDIVLAHDGDISVEVQQGTKISFWLPVRS